MFMTLTGTARVLWDEYRHAEVQGLRTAVTATLDRFIEALLHEPQGVWHPWACSLAAEIVDERFDLKLRQPLFDQVVFPALASGVDQRSPGCARWLGGLVQNLYKSQACRERLPPDLRSERGLLRLALDHDPDDHRARRRLINTIASGFWYSLHELPSGVLYGSDGATSEQCDEMLAELDELHRLVRVEGCEAAQAFLIEKCAFHFAAYRAYLLQRPRQGDYATFVALRGRSPSERP